MTIESISKMIPSGNRLELPKDDHFSDYAQVKKALITAGGKYRRNGFDFKEDAAVIQQRLIGGEVINDVKKYQYFPTPPAIADQVIDWADIQPHHDVLEPSAGQGALLRGFHCRHLTLVEIMPQNYKALCRQKFPRIHAESYGITHCDFMKYELIPNKFDRIIANPPFTKNQDIDHVLHMWDLLADGGRLVSIMSRSWMNGSQKKQVAFREFLAEHNGEAIHIERGAFKESGTMVPTCIMVLNK